jgi:hypothetical protein
MWKTFLHGHILTTTPVCASTNVYQIQHMVSIISPFPHKHKKFRQFKERDSFNVMTPIIKTNQSKAVTFFSTLLRIVVSCAFLCVQIQFHNIQTLYFIQGVVCRLLYYPLHMCLVCDLAKWMKKSQNVMIWLSKIILALYFCRVCWRC